MRKIRVALRSLAQTPVVTVVVVLSLGLGIGANTAIFSLLHQVVLRSLPVSNPETLVLPASPGEFKSGSTSTDNSGGGDLIFSYRVFRALEKQPQGVAGLAAFRLMGSSLAFGSQSSANRVLLVSGRYFPLLGVQPLFGRAITPEDDAPSGGHPVAVLGYGYWKDHLGGRLEVLNQTLRVNGQSFTIVGVAPREFTGTTLGSEPAAFLPLVFKPQVTPGWKGADRWDDYWLYLLARLQPGISREQAAAALNSVYAGLAEEQSRTVKDRDAAYVKRFRESRLTLRDGKQGHSSLRDATRVPILILMTATGMVLLIAMANAANLLLARAAQRRRELAIRAALGAGRSDILAQLLTEALLLGLAGGAAGLVLGFWTLRVLIARFAGGEEPVYFLTAGLDWQVLLFALTISVLTGLLFGLYPAWEGSRASLLEGLKDQSSQSSSSRGGTRVRRLLVCAQVAISVLLLVPTGLFLKSLVNLLHVDLGMQTENVVTFGIAPELNGYKPEQSRALFERAEEQLAAIAGVRTVSTAMVPLIGGSNWGNSLTVEGFASGPNSDTHSMFNQIGAGFFSKMGIPLIAGREFTPADNLRGPKVAVVNQEFARHFFGNRNPLGRKFTLGWGNVVPNIEIVGVIRDAHYSGVKQKPPRVYYIPWRQSKDIGEIYFYVRTALPAEQMIPQVRRVMAGLDRTLPLAQLRTFEEQIQRDIRSDRLVLQLAAVFAALATLLAMLGLYGVMSYGVIQRTREIGIRIALGAAPQRIRSMVMREVLWILAIGVAIGLPCALAMARLTESQLFEVKVSDPLVIAGAVAGLALAALLAGYLPVHRASRVNPLEALRYE